ncbi:hypothetical protein NIES3585_15780 [Nodularia sp. NIES-3585]|nr:hypothetical protein NIES3585_15780 [Nodularia sp. NIES-3585]
MYYSEISAKVRDSVRWLMLLKFPYSLLNPFSGRGTNLDFGDSAIQAQSILWK